MVEQAIQKRWKLIREHLLKEHPEAVVSYILTAAKMMSVNSKIAVSLAEQFNENKLDLAASMEMLNDLGDNMEYFAEYANASLNLSTEELNAANSKAIGINQEMQALLKLVG